MSKHTPRTISIHMADCHNQLLREIAEPCMKRRDIAQTYRLAMDAEKVSSERVDWKAVNAAIMARWSRSGLEWIKKQAHSGKCFAPTTGQGATS